MGEANLFHIRVGEGEDAREIAVRHRSGKQPGLFWLGGFRSDMAGSKATAIDEYAAAHGLAATRFDYSGHGQSGGRFEDGTISRWLEEALAVLDAHAEGRQIVVGSSMGGWIALLLAASLSGRSPSSPLVASRSGQSPSSPPVASRSGQSPSSPPVASRSGQSPSSPPAAETFRDSGRVAGLLLIAPAVDMTRTLMWDRWSKKARKTLIDDGIYHEPSAYADEPYPITRGLIDDGDRHLFGDRLIEVGCPVHILQGMQDKDVPWRHAQDLVTRLAADDVVLTLVKDGDHRLSRPEDIERLYVAIDGLVAEAGQAT